MVILYLPSLSMRPHRTPLGVPVQAGAHPLLQLLRRYGRDLGEDVLAGYPLGVVASSAVLGS
jgi:hypothetical protein